MANLFLPGLLTTVLVLFSLNNNIVQARDTKPSLPLLEAEKLV